MGRIGFQAGDAAGVKEKLAEYEQKLGRYEGEKREIKESAENLEKMRSDFGQHSQTFGIAVILFQVSILLSSIAGLFKRKEPWILGVILGGAGVVFFINGFWVLF